MNTSSFSIPGFKPKIEEKRFLQFLVINLILLTIIFSMFIVVGASDATIPMTGFGTFDNMYYHYMTEESELVNDIMIPVNDTVFFIIKLEMQILGTFLLLLCITSATFAIWYAARPEFADEVSEVKMRTASGESIPFDDPKAFFLQFCPDIKANSGISDSYEYEKPTVGLLVRDHLLKFVLLFAIAIALQQSTIITFIVKAGNALAYGANYYTENTDFKGTIETMTTAGRDYPVSFDTLTTKGQNQKKLYNAIYIALKREKPRDRTEAFLGRIGAKTQEFVEVTAANNGVDYDLQNFIVNVFVTGHNNQQANVSDLEIRMVENTTTFGITPTDDETSAGNISDKYVYISILQYDTAPESGSTSPYASAKDYEGSWIISDGLPTRLDVHKYVSYISANENDDHKFKGDAQTALVTVYYSDGSKETQNVTGTFNSNKTQYSFNLSGIVKTKSGNVSITRVTIEGIAQGSGGAVSYGRDGESGYNVKNKGSWTPNR